jgi:hypothetical protein
MQVDAIHASVGSPRQTRRAKVVDDVRRLREALHNDNRKGSDRMRVITWRDANGFEFLGAATYSHRVSGESLAGSGFG